ncbi:MAG: hypothetical protein AB3N23_13555 [Paracoccaceae bacterium]
MKENSVEKVQALTRTEAPMTFVVTEELLARLRQKVLIQSEDDLHEFVADAINTYVHLGRLCAGGATIFATSPSSNDYVELHFPFDLNPTLHELSEED